MTTRQRHVALACALAALPLATPAAAQPFLDPAVAQYRAADYEGALATLDSASAQALTTVDRVALDHYRVLCLLALGRIEDAQAATGRVFVMHPGYTLDPDTSPRVKGLFDAVRARVLPEQMRARYSEAKADFDARRHFEAATGFAVVADLGRVALAAGLVSPPLDDLLMVAAGFEQLATSLADRERAGAVAPLAGSDAALAASGPSAGLSSTAARADEYGPDSAGVVPPVAISQPVSAWHRNVPRPRAGAPLGTVEVLVDESGAVVQARVLSSVSAFYDVLLLESARNWRYRPATRDGRPVRYRRVTAIVAGG